MTESLPRIGWLQRTGYLGRKSLFMDLNFWIDLTKTGKENEELKELLILLVDEEILICPVSRSLIKEGEKQGNDKKRNDVYEFMDKLSGGLSLRMMHDTFHDEFKSVLDEEQIERGFAYTYYVQSFTPSIIYPIGSSFPIARYINEFDLSDPVKDLMRKYSERAGQEWTWREKGMPSAAKIDRMEFDATKIEFQPQIQEVMDELGLDYSTYSESDLKVLLDQCPTFFCSYKSMSALRASGQALVENDVFDFLNTSFAVPYADCLACDGRSIDVLRQRLKLNDKYGTHIVSSKAELMDWLKGIS